MTDSVKAPYWCEYHGEWVDVSQDMFNCPKCGAPIDSGNFAWGMYRGDWITVSERIGLMKQEVSYKEEKCQ